MASIEEEFDILYNEKLASHMATLKQAERVANLWGIIGVLSFLQVSS